MIGGQRMATTWPEIDSRRVFVFRWGTDPFMWDGSVTPSQSIKDLRDLTENERNSSRDTWAIGTLKHAANKNQVRVGDVLLFDAGKAKFKPNHGLYGIAIAGSKGQTTGGLAAFKETHTWSVRSHWIPKVTASLSRSPAFRREHAWFSPNGIQGTLYRPKKIPKAIRDFVQASLSGRPPPPPEPVTDAELEAIEKPIARLRELPKKERQLVQRTITQVVRSALLRKRVLAVWEPKCAACGRGIHVGDTHECEVAHIRDVWAKGADQISNGIPLCRTHHWAFDQHLWGIRPTDLAIVVRPEFQQNPLFKGLHGRKIKRPKTSGKAQPLAEAYLKWRWKEFKNTSKLTIG